MLDRIVGSGMQLGGINCRSVGAKVGNLVAISPIFAKITHNSMIEMIKMIQCDEFF